MKKKEYFMLAGVLLFFGFDYIVSLIESESARLGFLKLLFEIAFWGFVICLIRIIYSWIKNKKLNFKFSFYIWFLCFFLFSIPYLPRLFGYKTTQIGNLYEASAYTESYLVIMSRKPEDEKPRKEYTLPAQIYRQSDYDHTTRIRDNFYGEQTGGRDIHSLNYHIRYLYFSDGGFLSFDYDEAYDNPDLTIIIPNKETKVIDYKGDEYYITLTKEKAK